MATPVAFEILIERRGKKFRAVVVGSTAEARFLLPELREVESFHARCSARSRSPRNLALDDASSETDAKEIGARLFRALFAGEVGKRFDKERREAKAQSSKLRLRLRLTDPALDVQPWEYLYDPQEEEFLSLAGDVSVVRAIEAGVSRSTSVSGPLRMLLVGSCPPGLDPLDLQKEQDAIEAALSKYVRHHLLVIERLKPVTLRALSDRLRSGDVHILHFLGHGTFEHEAGGVLYLEDALGETMAADRELLDVLLRQESLRLVFLNACEGARLSPDARFSGVAQTLLRRGVPAVLAMQCPVEDRFAIALAGNFYRALARTGRIADALTEARRDLLGDGFREEWGAPVLYLHALDGELFPPLRIGRWGTVLDRLRETDRATWIKLAAALVGLAILGGISRGVVNALDPCPSPVGLDLRFAYIPDGSFWMGSNAKGDGPIHKVTLTKPFCLAIDELTNAQWRIGMTQPAPGKVRGDAFPVADISWFDAKEFVARLNEKDPAGKFRLPTEAEWEYAARGGGEKDYTFGGDPQRLADYGNCYGKVGDDHFDKSGPVGSFKATRWGLHDMYGNLSEWVEDISPYDHGAVKDPVGLPRVDGQHMLRGGSFRTNAANCRPTHRGFANPSYKNIDTGFRIVRDPVR